MMSCWAEVCFRGEYFFMSCFKVEEDRTSPLIFVALLNLYNALISFAHLCSLSIVYPFVLRFL